MKDGLLLYEHKCLKEKISALPLALQTKDIISQLNEMGVLKTNKQTNPKTGKNDLNYSQKVGKKTIRFYAFYLDRLKEAK